MSLTQVPLPNFARCNAFWSRAETDRPLLATWVGSYQFPDLFPIGLARLKEGVIEPGDIVFEDFREDYEALFAQHSPASADLPWAAFPLAVLPWAEAIAGCPVVHREGNIWAERGLVDSYAALEDRGGLKPKLAWLETLVEFTRWLVKLSAGRFPVVISLLRGPADLLAAMRGAQTSVLDLVDDPAPVLRTLDALTDLWIRAAHAQLAQIPPFAGGYGWNIQNLWSDRPGGWFQDDAIAFWSPSLHRRYAAPLEAKLSRCLAATGCHLHSAALFTVDELLKMPDLDVIEMNLDVVGKTIPQMIPQFQRILERKRLYVWGRFTAEDLQVMHAQLPSRGLALQLMDSSPEAVQRMIRAVEAIWR